MSLEPIPSAVARLVDQLRAPSRTGPVLVATDFDGVLAPLVDDPEASRATPAAAAALVRLAGLPQDRVQVALVSGRNLDTLARLSDAPSGTILVGSHGAERGAVRPGRGAGASGDASLDRAPFDLTPTQAATLDDVARGLEDVAREVDGAWVEHKPSAAVLHTRLSPGATAGLAVAQAVALGERLGAHVMVGKDVVEVAVVETSKGQALLALRDELRSPAVFYMGDDVTDERAFAVLAPDDVTVKVGAGETVAQVRVAGPDDAAALLTTLADAFERALG